MRTCRSAVKSWRISGHDPSRILVLSTLLITLNNLADEQYGTTGMVPFPACNFAERLTTAWLATGLA